jgi:hypothetical protein
MQGTLVSDTLGLPVLDGLPFHMNCREIKPWAWCSTKPKPNIMESLPGKLGSDMSHDLKTPAHVSHTSETTGRKREIKSKNVSINHTHPISVVLGGTRQRKRR